VYLPDATIVVNNAGILVVSSVLAIGAADVRRMFKTNVYGPIWISQAYAPVLARSGGGAFTEFLAVTLAQGQRRSKGHAPLSRQSHRKTTYDTRH
jgi:NAD(P)-dependent dehydrogenase (short-subunit alcohol dehydrogenase family)